MNVYMAMAGTRAGQIGHPGHHRTSRRHRINCVFGRGEIRVYLPSDLTSASDSGLREKEENVSTAVVE